MLQHICEIYIICQKQTKFQAQGPMIFLSCTANSGEGKSKDDQGIKQTFVLEIYFFCNKFQNTQSIMIIY